MTTLKTYLDPKTWTAINVITDEKGTRVISDEDIPEGSVDFIEMFTDSARFEAVRKTYVVE